MIKFVLFYNVRRNRSVNTWGKRTWDDRKHTQIENHRKYLRTDNQKKNTQLFLEMWLSFEFWFCFLGFNDSSWKTNNNLTMKYNKT